MKTLLLYLFLLLFSSFNGQIGNDEELKKIAIILNTRIELTSIDNKAFFSFGSKIPINETNYVSLRGHFNWWDLPKRKFIVIPELDYFNKIASYEKDKAIIRSLYVGAGITPNAVSPKFGVNFYHLFTAELGYNYEFRPYKYFSTEGFRFSVGINFVY